MTTTQNIQTLSLTSRAYVHNALIAAGITGESLDDAMHSRLCDLEDTLDSAVLARVVATEQGQAAWAAISTAPNVVDVLDLVAEHDLPTGLTYLVPTALESYALTNHFN